MRRVTAPSASQLWEQRFWESQESPVSGCFSPQKHPRRSGSGKKGRRRGNGCVIPSCAPRPSKIHLRHSRGPGQAEGNKGGAPQGCVGGSLPPNSQPGPPRPAAECPQGCVLTPGSPLNGRKEILILGKGWTRPLPPAGLGRGPGPRITPAKPGRTPGSVLVGSHGNGDRLGGRSVPPKPAGAAGGLGGSQLRPGAGVGRG